MNISVFLKERLALPLCISSLFVYPILNSGVYYVDDIARTSNGGLGWGVLGRPISDLLMLLLSFSSTRLADVTPLPQIISIIIIAFSIFTLSLIFDKESKLATTIASASAILFPFFIQNIAYRFDSLSMSLALLSVICGAYLSKSKNIILIVTSCLLIISSLSLYQPYYILFPIITCIVILKDLSSNVDYLQITKYLAKSIILFSISYILYKVLVLDNVVNTGRSGFDLNPHSISKKSIEIYNLYIISYSGMFSFFLISSVCASVLLSLNIVSSKTLNVSRKIITITYLVICYALITSISVMSIAILKDGLIVPRVLPGMGFILVLPFFIIPANSRYALNNLCLIPTSLMLMISISTSFATSSSLTFQSDYDNFVAKSIVLKLTEAEFEGKQNIIYGRARTSWTGNINKNIFPITNKITTPMFDWTGFILTSRYGANDVIFSFSDREKYKTIALEICKQRVPAAFKSKNFSIYSINNINFIWLGNNC